MKQLFFSLLFLLKSIGVYAQVGINTTSPHASAALDVTSVGNNKGLLPPRMTTAERNAIDNPAAGLTIYNTTVNCLQWWNGTIWYEGCLTPAENLISQYPAGTVFCGTVPTSIVNVTNPSTGKTWMDRNLGATRAATSSTDAQAYGSLYQWGRGSDGHHCVNRYQGDGVTTSGTTTALSNMDQPGNGNFILTSAPPNDWRSPQNNNLWQGVNGINNPCPTGYRLPTEMELNAERLSWGSNNASGAFASPLKLPLAGGRSDINGLPYLVGNIGRYCSSTVIGSYSRFLGFDTSNANVSTIERADGFSVRCIKN